MDLRIREFCKDDVAQAMDIFLEGYRNERKALPILPPEVIDEPKRIMDSMEKMEGVAAFIGNKMVGYLIAGPKFHFKGQRTVMSPEHGHGAVGSDRADIYRRMYMAASGNWVRNGANLHIVGHLSHDDGLRETLFMLGFGAVVSENVRDLSPVKVEGSHDIARIGDPESIIDLQMEHNGYYLDAPIFLNKPADRNEELRSLEEHLSSGDVIFALMEGGYPQGYMIVGESSKGHEGFLMRGTRTAQVKSAYIRPGSRRKGAGASLLRECIDWASANGYLRMFVEHETANYYGGAFWEKHFETYLCYSMRYVDNSFGKQ